MENTVQSRISQVLYICPGMRPLAGLVALVLLLIVLRDAFETVILPRRVRRRFQLTRIFYRTTWHSWRAVATRLAGSFAEHALGWFGPFSLLLLLVLWATTIVLSFAVMQWAIGPGLRLGSEPVTLLESLYFSGTTFFTLGLGDIAPVSPLAKLLTVGEAGLGFAFLAVVVGYLPVIYQAFSRREVIISLLDARAGSPPTTGELLRRHGEDPGHLRLQQLLAEWERWAAEVLETNLSYPVLAYFRSQHSNQSWLAALTILLDTSAVAALACETPCRRQAELTFAMARHAVVDLAQVFNARSQRSSPDRLPSDDFERLRAVAQGSPLDLPRDAESRLTALRSLYEPYLTALSSHLELPLARWLRSENARLDNWEAAPWNRPGSSSGGWEHFMDA